MNEQELLKGFYNAVEDLETYVLWPLNPILRGEDDFGEFLREMSLDRKRALQALNKYHEAAMSSAEYTRENSLSREGVLYLVNDVSKVVVDLFSIVFRGHEIWKENSEAIEVLKQLIENTEIIFNKFENNTKISNCLELMDHLIKWKNNINYFFNTGACKPEW